MLLRCGCMNTCAFHDLQSSVASVFCLTCELRLTLSLVCVRKTNASSAPINFICRFLDGTKLNLVMENRD